MDNLKYINHMGESIGLSDWPIVLQSESLYDFLWNYSAVNSGKKGGYIERFFKDVKEKDIDLAIHATNQADFAKAMNDFYQITEIDVLANKSGRISRADDSYLPCYVIGGENSQWSKGIKTNLKGTKLLTAYPFWCLDKKYEFHGKTDTPQTDGLDFPTDFPFDFARGSDLQILINDVLYDSNFEMIIQGPTPAGDDLISIVIGGNIYEVHTKLYQNEYLIINSRDRFIDRHRNTGEVMNCMDLRSFDHNVFEPIKKGEHTVQSSLIFDITLFQERNEPVWNL